MIRSLLAATPFAVAAVAAVAALAGCTDQTVERLPSARPPATEEAPPADPPVKADAGVAAPDAAPTAPTAPVCAATLGAALTAEHGRLDGIVRAVIAPGDKTCRSDDDHVIVQIDTAGATYAAWVNVESSLAVADPQVRFAQTRAPLALGAWAEGWHPSPGVVDYASTLDMHVASFVALDKGALAARIAALVAPGDRVSAYVEGFAAGDGGHKVHRNGGGRDGALVVIEPAGAPRWLLFHFAQQTF